MDITFQINDSKYPDSKEAYKWLRPKELKDNGTEYTDDEWVAKCHELYDKEVRKQHRKYLLSQQVDAEEGESASSQED